MSVNKKIYRNISLSLGKECFVFCPGCYNNKIIYHNPLNSPVVSADEIMAFVKKVKDQIDLSEITISGGDPLTYEHLSELVAKLKALGIFVKLDTLGTAFLADSQSVFPEVNLYKKVDFEQLAKNVGMIGIPLDGSTDEFIGKFRTGRKNLLDETKRILALTEKYHAATGINVVVNKFNLDDLENIFLIVAQFSNIQKIQFFQFCPTGCLAKAHRKTFEISEEDFLHRTDYLQQKYADHPIKIERKPCAGRGNNYLFINQFGIAYHTDIFEQSDKASTGNIINKKIYGNIKNEKEFANIFNNGLKRNDI